MLSSCEIAAQVRNGWSGVAASALLILSVPLRFPGHRRLVQPGVRTLLRDRDGARRSWSLNPLMAHWWPLICFSRSLMWPSKSWAPA